MAKEEKEEKGILDTMGDAASAVGEFISDKLSGRDFTEEGLKKMQEKAKKEKPKQKPKKVTAKPKNVSQRVQRSESPSGAQFNTVTETDNRNKQMKEGPVTLINTDKVESSIARLKELQKRLRND